MYSIYGIHTTMKVLIISYKVIGLNEAQSPEDYLLANGIDILSAEPVRELCLEDVQEGDAIYSTMAGNGQRVHLQDPNGARYSAYVMEA